MQPRATPRQDVSAGWPYMQTIRAGVAYTLLIRGGPSQRSDLAAWVRESRSRPTRELIEADQRLDVLRAREGTDAAEPGDYDEGRALMAGAPDAVMRSARATEGTAGFLILWAWCDITTDLQARLDYDAHAFAGTEDPRLAAGLACVAELYDEGWTWEQIDDLSTAILGTLSRGQVDRAITMELRPFGLDPGSTT